MIAPPCSCLLELFFEEFDLLFSSHKGFRLPARFRCKGIGCRHRGLPPSIGAFIILHCSYSSVALYALSHYLLNHKSPAHRTHQGIADISSVSSCSSARESCASGCGGHHRDQGSEMDPDTPGFSKHPFPGGENLDACDQAFIVAVNRHVRI